MNSTKFTKFRQNPTVPENKHRHNINKIKDQTTQEPKLI